MMVRSEGEREHVSGIYFLKSQNKDLERKTSISRLDRDVDQGSFAQLLPVLFVLSCVHCI